MPSKRRRLGTHNGGSGPRLKNGQKHQIVLLFVKESEAPLPPALPDVEGGVEDVGFLQLVQLDLGVTHLVVHAFQLVVQLQLLPLELAVFLLVPPKETKHRWVRGLQEKRSAHVL